MYYQSQSPDQAEAVGKTASSDAPDAVRREKQPGPSEIEPGILLGSLDDAKSSAIRIRFNIESLLSAIDFAMITPPAVHTHYQIRIRDGASEDILQHLSRATTFMLQAQLDRRAFCKGSSSVVNPPSMLVHCFAGVSRSTTLVAAYLIRTRGLSTDDAISCIRSLRPQVNPNSGFVAQLRVWEERVRTSNMDLVRAIEWEPGKTTQDDGASGSQSQQQGNADLLL